MREHGFWCLKHRRHGHRHHKHGGFFGRWGEGGMGRSGMRAAKMLASGDLQLIILALLNEKPHYGYEIIKALEEHSSGVYTPSPGMVYPALTYLEEMGYADSTADGMKKLFKITEGGTEHLTKNRSEADETMAGLARYGKRVADFQKQFSQEEEANEDFAGGGKAEGRQLKMEFKALKEELKMAIFEKIHSPIEEKKRVLDVIKRCIAEIRGADQD